MSCILTLNDDSVWWHLPVALYLSPGYSCFLLLCSIASLPVSHYFMQKECLLWCVRMFALYLDTSCRNSNEIQPTQYIVLKCTKHSNIWGRWTHSHTFFYSHHFHLFFFLSFSSFNLFSRFLCVCVCDYFIFTAKTHNVEHKYKNHLLLSCCLTFTLKYPMLRFLFSYFANKIYRIIFFVAAAALSLSVFSVSFVRFSSQLLCIKQDFTLVGVKCVLNAFDFYRKWCEAGVAHTHTYPQWKIFIWKDLFSFRYGSWKWVAIKVFSAKILLYSMLFCANVETQRYTYCWLLNDLMKNAKYKRNQQYMKRESYCIAPNPSAMTLEVFDLHFLPLKHSFPVV